MCVCVWLQAHVQLGNFEPAKSCLKKVLKLPRVGGVDLSVIESQLKTGEPFSECAYCSPLSCFGVPLLNVIVVIYR